VCNQLFYKRGLRLGVLDLCLLKGLRLPFVGGNPTLENQGIHMTAWRHNKMKYFNFDCSSYTLPQSILVTSFFRACPCLRTIGLVERKHVFTEASFFAQSNAVVFASVESLWGHLTVHCFHLPLQHWQYFNCN